MINSTIDLVSSLDPTYKIQLENYSDQKMILPYDGQQIICNQSNEFIIVYQAYKKSIADFAVENQCFGGSEFLMNRMSWIKPNFLWMMFRSGWAEKENQERILALWITKNDFLDILSNAVHSSFNDQCYESEQDWKNKLNLKPVRLQWDPDHHPSGAKIERRAIQLGLKDNQLLNFIQTQVKHILDITTFVKEQGKLVQVKEYEKLIVPVERIYSIENVDLNNKLGIFKV